MIMLHENFPIFEHSRYIVFNLYSRLHKNLIYLSKTPFKDSRTCVTHLILIKINWDKIYPSNF